MLNRILEADKTKLVESTMTSGHNKTRLYTLLIVCGMIQIGVYSVFVSGLVGASIFASKDHISPSLLVWPEWIIKPGFAWIGGIFTDKFGRKNSLFSSIFLALIFSLASSLISDSQLELYLVFRVFVCIMIGAVQVTNYVYVSESVAQKFRTKCLFVLVITDCIGTLYGYAVMQIGTIEWKMRLLISSIPLLISGLLVFFFLKNETPKYLVVSGQADKAFDQMIPTTPPAANRNIRKQEFVRSLTTLACPRSQRGRIATLFRVGTVSNPNNLPFLLFLWFVQAIVYWGAMSALPHLFGGSATSLEILLLLYVFELIGIFVAAICASKISVEKTLVGFKIVSTVLVAIVAISMAVSAPWFLSASICGMFGSLTPIWGILFVISTESFSPQVRATGLGLLMSTRIVQGVLETSLPSEPSHSWRPLIYVCIAFGFSAIGVIVSLRKCSTWSQRPKPPTTPSESPVTLRTDSTVSSPKLFSINSVHT